jgi:HK97 family phage major capsid protein
MKLTKDADGNYVMPPFATESGDIVNGVRVVQNTKIPVGYFLMGDFSKAHVRTYKDYSVRVGYTGDDFEKNLVTILGESRVHLWISDNEEAAFVYDQFSVAKTALETP